jgi:hypothetical protein
MRLASALAAVLVCALVALLANGIMRAREAARDASCQGRMNQLELAFRNYHDTKGNLPPAHMLGPGGKPWHSWRMLILPYIEEHDVYDRYNFDEPWNGPNNRKLADQIYLEIFQCPSGSDIARTQNTNYVVVVGNETAFPGDQTTKFADFKDGIENTILLVEVEHTGIHWMEPRDLEFNSLTLGASTPDSPAVSSPHPRGPAVVFADEIHAYRLRHSMNNATLRALATIAGGEPITRDALKNPSGGSSLSDDWERGTK